MPTRTPEDTSEAVYGLGITPGLGYITGPQGQRAEQEALKKDRSQARRVVVSLVGRERQGKTSLRRLLAGEPFNKDEPSTVGLERDLVETQALDAGSGPGGDWWSLGLDTANKVEFEEMLGRRIRQRLENQRNRIPMSRRFINAFLTMAKIGIIGYVSIFLYLVTSSCQALWAGPTWGFTNVVMFLLCGAIFGKKDGFGIAVGVYHLMVLVESFIRWNVIQRFDNVVANYGMVCAYLLGAVAYGLVESFVAICFGLSLGLGMACMFCLSKPEYIDYFQDGNPLMKPELHFMVVSCLFGLGFMQNRYSRLLIPPVLGVLLVLLPTSLSFAFTCGTSIGAFHGLALGLGRWLFLTLNQIIKKITTRTVGRHMVRHCLGLIPGALVSQYIFGWTFVTSPWQNVIAHVISAAVLVTVNEVDISIKIVPCLSVSVSSISSSAPASSQSSSSPSLSAATPSVTSASSAGTSHGTPRAKHSFHQEYIDSLLSRKRSDSCSLARQQPTSVLARSAASSSPIPRLVVRDFAGHPLYYSAHHVYMAAHCVYVLVFSLVQARHHFHSVLHNLIDWLQSIFLHTGFPDTRVFLVGTHRDDPCLREAGVEDFVSLVGKKLKKEIPRHFHNMLVWTDKDVPLFPVENSIRDHKDPDHRYLRRQLLQTVADINEDKFPVRYFYFFNVLDSLRSSGRLLADTDRLLEQCRNNQCAIRDRSDMDAMLMLFQRLGEVLYFPEDNLLQSVVVLSPHVVLSVLSRLMDVPKMADRARRYVTEWDKLASTGICSRALFDHVLSQQAKELCVQRDTVIYLLQTLNLICPLSIKGGNWGLQSRDSGGGSGDGYSGDGLRHRGCQRGRDKRSNERGGGRRHSGDSGSGGGGGTGGGSGGGGGGDDGGDGGGPGRSDHNNDDDDDGGGGSSDSNNESDEDNEDITERTVRERGELAEHDQSYGEEEQYLVPAALPRELPQNHCIWDTSAKDWQLLVDGLPVLPHPAFLRLLNVCVTQDACDCQDDLGRPVLTACQTCAAFTFGRSRCYKMEWVKTGETADTYHGRLLKLVVAASDVRQNPTVAPNSQGRSDSVLGRNILDFSSGSASNIETVSPQTVVDFVWKSLVEIVRRDFGRCHVRLGVACPCSAPHQVSCDEAGFHFLSVSDTRGGTVQIPETKEFWCRGRHVLYKNGKVYEVSQSGGGPRRCDGSLFPLPLLSTPLRSMPQGLHASICDLLDIPHVLGNDWTALAGHLRKTTHEVNLLRFRAPRDPCDALLQDWACRDPQATVGDLMDIMRTMERLDVIRTIEDFSL